MNSNTPDVLIVGAGPVGMTAASELARWGVNVRIVDKKPGPTEESRAGLVQVRTLEVLDAIGIVDHWKAVGYPLNYTGFRAFGKRLGTIDLSGVNSPHPAPLMIGQDVTEQLLCQQLQSVGIPVEYTVEALGFTQDKDGVNVTLRHADGQEELAHAHWIIGCEGSHSLVRETLNISWSGQRYEDQEVLILDATLRWSYPLGRGYVFIEKDLLLICFPWNDAGSYRFICVRWTDADSNHSQPSLAEMQQLLQQIVCNVADPDASLENPTWSSRFHLQYSLAGHMRQGRALIAGDAVHVHAPVAGQGMNTGMQDAFNLAWKLASVIKGVVRPELLDSYNLERHIVAQSLISGTDRSFRVLTHPNTLVEWVMKLLGPIALNWETIQNRFRTTVAETDIGYPDSPLTEERVGSHGLAAGDRVPDATVVRLSDRQTIRLFEVLRGTRWTLLLLGGWEAVAETYASLQDIGKTISSKYREHVETFLVAAGLPIPSNSSVPVLMDLEHSLHKQFEADSTCLYLVRPDWYVGFRGKPENIDNLMAYLARVFIV